MSGFRKIPTLIAFLVVVATMLDFMFSSVYLATSGKSWREDQIASRVQAEKAFRIRSKLYHHDLKGNVDGEGNAFWGDRRYTVKTNSLGFKDRSPRQIYPEASRHRILFIGDSFTEAVGLDYDESFVGLVDRELAADIEVLNAGVSTYSPIIYWRKVKYLLEEVGLQVDEVIVYLDLSDIPDEAQLYCADADNSVMICEGFGQGVPQANVHPWKRFLGDHFILLQVTYYLLKDWLTDPVPPVDAPASRWTTDPVLFKTVGRPGLERSRLYLDKLHDMLRERGISMTLAVYPHPAQIHEDDRNSIQLTYWRAWAREQGVAFVEHFTSLFRRRDEIGAEATINRYYIRGDIHFNARGNRLLFRELMAQHFPSSHSIPR